MEYINYVGIDMAKRDFYACLAEDREPIKFQNNKIGIDMFFKCLGRSNFGKQDTVLGVESTGSYHLPICVASQSAGYAIKVINPLIVKKQNLTTLRRVKNDKKDAALIRYCLNRGNGYEYRASQDDFMLKALVRQRNAISYNKLRIRRQKDDLDYKGNIIKTKINTIYDELYVFLEQKQKQIEKELANYNQPIQKLLQSIPGVGPVTAASFVSEIGEIKKFKHPKHLIAYIGIDPRVHESGTSVRGKGYISKRGNKILRTILFNAASVAVLHNNMFRQYFQRKISEGKPYRVALVATMNKMARVIHAVWTRGTPFENKKTGS